MHRARAIAKSAGAATDGLAAADAVGSVSGGSVSGTWPALGLGAIALGTIGLALVAYGGLDWLPLAGALAVYAAIAGIVAHRIGAYHPHARFGAANGVTLARAVINCLLVGLLLDLERLAGHEATVGMIFIAFAALSLALDGLDGLAARRLRLESRFGARFDVEVDGLLLVLLATAAYSLDKAGIWVLAIGGVYYVFLAAQRLMPWLQAPLPPSFRRKAVCVVQGASLVVLLLPFVEPPVSTAIAAGALAALAWSFAVDVVLLWRMRRA